MPLKAKQLINAGKLARHSTRKVLKCNMTLTNEGIVSTISKMMGTANLLVVMTLKYSTLFVMLNKMKGLLFKNF